MSRIARPADWKDLPTLSPERRRVFIIQRLGLFGAIGGLLAGIAWAVVFLLNLDSRALAYASDHLEAHGQAHAEAVAYVQGQEQQVLGQVARTVISDPTASFQDKSQRMQNLDQLFQLSRSWSEVANRPILRRDVGAEALTYFVSPLTGKMVPLNATRTGAIQPSALKDAGATKDFDALMAMARERAAGEMPKDPVVTAEADTERRLLELSHSQSQAPQLPALGGSR